MPAPTWGLGVSSTAIVLIIGSTIVGVYALDWVGFESGRSGPVGDVTGAFALGWTRTLAERVMAGAMALGVAFLS